MKKLLSMVLALIMVFAFSGVAMAADLDEAVTESVDNVNYQGVMQFGNSISKTNGIAKCYYYIDMHSGYKADVTTILQKSSGGAWSEVTSWSHSQVNTLDELKTRAVVSGYSYRIKTYANVYDLNGNFIEQAMKISNTV